MITTVKEIRDIFWEQHPQYKSEFRTRKRQKDYYTDIRLSFIDMTEHLRESGQITQKLADKIVQQVERYFSWGEEMIKP